MADMPATTVGSVSPINERRPRLGFLGVGWIGHNRMEAIAGSGLADVSMIYDASPETMQRSLASVPHAHAASCMDELLNADLDGIVIATPSGQHAEQAVRFLESGLAVFSQKPLGTTADQTRRVVETARDKNKLLAVDLSYRFTAAMEATRSLISSGQLGVIYAVNLIFHNAYSPDKTWCYDRALSGGGCVIDLGIHLIDAALWMLDFPYIKSVNSKLYSQGQLVANHKNAIEDYAAAQIDLDSGSTIHMECSWRFPAGQDCVIAMEFFGTQGAASFQNVNGSFYDFVAEHYEGPKRTRLVSPPDSWPGRAAVEWVKQLATGQTFDVKNEELVRVAEVLDAIYSNTPKTSLS